MGAIQQMLLAYGAGGGGGTDPSFANVWSLNHFDNTSSTADPYYDNVWALDYFDTTTNSDQVAARTWSNVGTPTINTTTKKFGAGALSVTPSNYITTPSTGLPSGNWTTVKFTVEFWLYAPLDMNDVVLVSTSGGTNSNGFLWRVNSDGSIDSDGYQGGGQSRLIPKTAAGAVTANTWQHIAWSKDTNTAYLFVNGVLKGSSSTANTIGTHGTLQIGGNGYFSNTGTFLLDDLRITTGIARYTTAFTPPTAAFSNTGAFTDQVTAQAWTPVGTPTINSTTKKFGAGALSVTPSNYLTVPTTGLASGNYTVAKYTIEMWVYTPLSTNAAGLLSTTQTNGVGLQFYINSNGSISSTLWLGGSTVAFVPATSAGVITANTWTHLAWVRDLSATYLFINGVLTTSGTSLWATNHNSTLTIGGPQWATNQASFLVDDLRITNDVARYTASFTPPTAAFPNS